MSETRKPTPEFDETLAQFPELTRARDLYIDLFKDCTPLVNLGYNNRQIEYASHTLLLLQEEGEVVTDFPDHPYLAFKNPDNEYESVDVNRLSSKQGFGLFALRDELQKEFQDLPPTERLIRYLLEGKGSPFQIFDIYGPAAKIALFEEGADILDLNYLVSQVYTPDELGFSLRRENIGSRLD